MLVHCDTCTTPHPDDSVRCPNCGGGDRHTNDAPLEGCPHCEETLMAKNTVHGGPSNALTEPEPAPAGADPAPAPEPEPEPVGETAAEEVTVPAGATVEPKGKGRK